LKFLNIAFDDVHYVYGLNYTHTNFTLTLVALNVTLVYTQLNLKLNLSYNKRLTNKPTF